MKKTLSPKTIKNRRKHLEKSFRLEEERLSKLANIFKINMQKLEARCSHENMGYASYCKWCNDCGATWDTT